MNRGIKNHLIKDAGIIGISIAVALLLAKTGAVREILHVTQGFWFLGSFIAGLFFTSVFTTAPATIVLAGIAQSNSIFWVAFLGGIGALVGDLVIFRFIKERLSADFLYLIKKSESERLISIFRLKLFRWLFPLVGALIVASPLPDELGLAMMGLSKMKTSLFIPLSFLLNFLGITVIGLIAKAL